MKTYSVKDIADMLNTNPETVRRWIRAGKLKADQSSRKDGNVVREEDLYKYLRSTGKYAMIAAGLAAANPFLAIPAVVSASVLGSIAIVLAKKDSGSESDIRILADDIKQTLTKSIAESEGLIKRKRNAIAELQAEIKKEQELIRDYEMALASLAGVLPVANDEGEVIG